MSAPDLLQSIATNLRKLRAHHGVTREQLGATAEVDPQLIKRIESGRANPALVVLSRLASALMISASLVLSSGDVVAETELPAAVEPFEGEAVGETMASLRKQRNLSRRALAQMAEVQAVTLAKYETATTDARILAIEPIAGALGMETSDFVRAVELRQRQLGAGPGWQSPSAGVLFRVVASGANSRLWEWRFAPHTAYAEQEPVAVEEIATAIRGRVRVELGDEVHHLHRGGSIVLPPSARPRFENAGTSTARLLRYRSVND